MERTLRGWKEGVEMDHSGNRGNLLSTTKPEYRSSWVMKIESAARSPPPTSNDLCSHAGWGCFVAAHQVKPPDDFDQIGFFGLLTIYIYLFKCEFCLKNRNILNFILFY
ncbi:hypothetical protein AVEN_221409-1 [Araneus ventricosus]|uniref:Uncharacterized protein n=1 Tax=Araneus ventricosus TaxID=182803 RepID=A0A4Y2TN54_ARAVE|nr:hypothetical protein AVEN_221409-1 [Araneus ventricosus]